MSTINEPINFEELKEGEHEVRPNLISKSNPDGTFNISYKEFLLATVFFQGTVKLYSAWFSKNNEEAYIKNCFDAILAPLNKVSVNVKDNWFICNKGQVNRQQVKPVPFKNILVINP